MRMNLFFPLDWYLNSLSDHRFLDVWERRFLRRAGKIGLFVFIVYIIVVFWLTSYVGGSTNVIIGFLFFISFGPLFAIVMILQYLRFMGRQNKRFIDLKMGMNSDIDYSNVVNEKH
jgi:apolipoprotein N-acyltransferase